MYSFENDNFRLLSVPKMSDQIKVTNTIAFIKATAADFPYFYQLRHATMLEHFIGAGKIWDDKIERANHLQNFNPETLQMIYRQERLTGFVDLATTASHIRLSLFCIEPSWQNVGIGTAVIKFVIQDAHRRGLRVCLDVLKNNKASRLYERLGFQRVQGEIDILTYYEL